jgi:ribosomal protein L1
MIRGPEKLEYIGVFADEHEAAEAYNARARLLYGEQAKLNAIRSRTKGPEPPVAIPSMTNLSVEDIKRILGARTASKE